MKIYSHTYLVELGDCDVFGNLKLSTLLRDIQNAATQHCEGTEVSRDALMRDLNGIWVLLRVKLHLNRPVKWKEELTVRTYHRGPSGAMLVRDFLFYVGEEQVGWATSGWVVVDYLDRHILRSAMVEARVEFQLRPPLMEEIKLTKLKAPGELRPCGNRTVRYSDLDVNRHLNNTIYGDILCDALELQDVEGSYVEDVQINFLKESLSGETLELLRSDGEGETYFLATCKGEKRFEAKVREAVPQGG